MFVSYVFRGLFKDGDPVRPSLNTEGPEAFLAESSKAVCATDVAIEAEVNGGLPDGPAYVDQTRHNDLCDNPSRGLGRLRPLFNRALPLVDSNADLLYLSLKCCCHSGSSCMCDFNVCILARVCLEEELNGEASPDATFEGATSYEATALSGSSPLSRRRALEYTAADVKGVTVGIVVAEDKDNFQQREVTRLGRLRIHEGSSVGVSCLNAIMRRSNRLFVITDLVVGLNSQYPVCVLCLSRSVQGRRPGKTFIRGHRRGWIIATFSQNSLGIHRGGRKRRYSRYRDRSCRRYRQHRRCRR